MKVLHICSSDLGGAANAAIRLHLGLLEIGVDSFLLVLKTSDRVIGKSQPFSSYQKVGLVAKLKRRLFRLLKWFRRSHHTSQLFAERPEGVEFFSSPKSEFDITKHVLYKQADIINLHWTAGFLDYSSFFKKSTKKIVWTLHDMNPFTGGCHYTSGCNQFLESCNSCPQLHARHKSAAKQGLKIKIESVKNISNLSIVAPSEWLFNESKKSKVFHTLPHYIIPYGLDKKNFNSLDKKYSRELLKLPANKKIVLFVSASTNQRKGFKYLIQAVNMIKQHSDILLCSVGNANANFGEIHNLIQLGVITDERLLSAAYSAADVFIIPSVEDNLPNTMLESLMCGTPVIGFATGGIKDVIVTRENGYLIETITVESLANAIEEFLNTDAMPAKSIRETAIKKYDLMVQAKAYQNLYFRLLKTLK